MEAVWVGGFQAEIKFCFKCGRDASKRHEQNLAYKIRHSRRHFHLGFALTSRENLSDWSPSSGQAPAAKFSSPVSPAPGLVPLEPFETAAIIPPPTS